MLTEPLHCVSQVGSAFVRMTLDRGGHFPKEACLSLSFALFTRMRRAGLQQLDATEAEVTCLCDGTDVRLVELAERWTEHRARFAGRIFDPSFALADLSRRLFVRQTGQREMVKRVPTDLESVGKQGYVGFA